MADDQTFHDEIEGYCASLSVAPGEALPLHVSTHADRFDVPNPNVGIVLDWLRTCLPTQQ